MAAAAATAACFSEHPAASGPGDPQTTAGACRVAVGSGGVQGVVAIKDFKFVPDTIRVPAGTTVTWVNCDESATGEPHTSTSDGRVWTSQLLPPAATYSYRFDTPGAFPYHCEPHPFMKATVIVQ
jgi:plastocyanin